MAAPSWLDLGDKFASIVGGAAGLTGLLLTIRDSGRRAAARRPEEHADPGPRGWIRLAAGLFCVPLTVAVLRAVNAVPGSLRTASILVAVAASVAACGAAVVHYVQRRRQLKPFSPAMRALFDRQWEDAQQHRYDYDGDVTPPPLLEIYVEQRTDRLAASPDGADGSARDGRLTLAQMLAGTSGAVLQAEPGVGKSTAIARVLREQCAWWRRARRAADPGGAPFGSAIPIALPADLHGRNSMSAALAAEWERLTGTEPQPRMFERPPPYADVWLVLIDGIDHIISTTERVRVLERLGAWVGQAGSPYRVLVTTRPLLGSELDRLTTGDVRLFVLRKFDDEGLHEFAARWYAYRKARHRPDRPEPIRPETFMASVTSASLRPLARVPLIATITELLLERDRQAALPTGRAELYERYVHHLVQARQLAQQGGAVPPEFAVHGLRGELAWRWLVDNLQALVEGTADLHLSPGQPGVVVSAVEWVRQRAPAGTFEALPGWIDALSRLLVRTGLVVPDAAGLRFVHPSFAEYLAAGPRAQRFELDTWLADARHPDSRNLALFILARLSRRSDHPAGPNVADALVELLLESRGTDVCVAGQIIADGVAVRAPLRALVVDELFAALTREELDGFDALRVLIDLTTDPAVLLRLERFAGDGANPGWMRVDTAEEICAIARDRGVALLRGVLTGTADDALTYRILRRLRAFGAATAREVAWLTAYEADAGRRGRETGPAARPGEWHRRIATSPDTEPRRRLRAVLAMAARGEEGWPELFALVIGHPLLTEDDRLGAARRVLESQHPADAAVVRAIADRYPSTPGVQLPLVAAMGEAQDDWALQMINRLTREHGDEILARFPTLAASRDLVGTRSSEQSPWVSALPPAVPVVPQAPPARSGEATGPARDGAAPPPQAGPSQEPPAQQATAPPQAGSSPSAAPSVSDPPPGITPPPPPGSGPPPWPGTPSGPGGPPSGTGGSALGRSGTSPGRDRPRSGGVGARGGLGGARSSPSGPVPPSSPAPADEARPGQGTVIGSAGRGSMPEVWGRIPVRNRYFTGRDESLSALGEAFSDAPRRVALVGPAGTGKTQIAVEYVYRVTERYDLVWWVPATRRSAALAALAELGRYLNLPSAAAASPADAAAAVRDALRRGRPYKRWLLIFDGAGAPDEVADLIPSVGTGHVIITSRDERWSVLAETRAVGIFSEAESREFIGHRLAGSVSGEDARLLAVALESLPLALEQACAVQSETGMLAAEFLRLFDERMAEPPAGDPSSADLVPLVRTWMVALDAVRERDRDASELLRLCAMFGAEPIPVELFSVRGSAGSPETAFLSDPIRRTRALRTLGRFALAHVEGNSRTVQVHRLLQSLVRARLTTADAERVRAGVDLLFTEASPGDPELPENWPAFRGLLPHVRPAGLVGSGVPAVRRLVLDVVRYLIASGDDDGEARQLTEEAVAAWRDDADAIEPNLARGYLGTILRAAGRLDEADHADQVDDAAAAEMMRLSGPERAETFELLRNAAARHRARGRFNAAREYDLELAGRFERLFTPGSAMLARSWSDCALDDALLGDYSSARDRYAQAYDLLMRNARQVCPVYLLRAWNGLARSTGLEGDWRAALMRAAEAQDHAETAGLNRGHPLVLGAIIEAAIARRACGDHERSARLAGTAWSLADERFGRLHPVTLAARVALAGASAAAGSLRDAYTHAEKAALGHAEVFGEEHPHTLGCRWNLALLHRRTGDPDRALRIDEHLLLRLAATIGPHHPCTLVVEADRLRELALLDRIDEAVRLAGDVLPRLRAVLGADHPATRSITEVPVVRFGPPGRPVTGTPASVDGTPSWDDTPGWEGPAAASDEDPARLDALLWFDPLPLS